MNLEFKVEKEYEEISKRFFLSNKTLLSDYFNNYNTFGNYDEVYDEIKRFLSNKNLILIGGQTVHFKFFGYRKMRKASTDIDVFAIDDVDITNTFNSDFLMKYDNFDSYIYLGEYPVVIHYRKIHDFEPDFDFYKRIQVIDNIKLNSPEYTIALKLKRAMENNRFFGKDKIDVANVILSHIYNKITIDEDFLIHLLKHFEINNELFYQIYKIPQLNVKEKEDLKYFVNNFLKLK